MAKITTAVLGVPLGLAGFGWLGLQIPSRRLPPHEERTRYLEGTDLPTDLPRPVHRYLMTVAGWRMPRVDSAVVWGRARFKLNGLWMPLRYKSFYRPGEGFYRRMEFTWFSSLILLDAYTAYVEGKGELRAVGVPRLAGSDGKTSWSEHAAMWAEAVWTPSAFVSIPGVRWQAIDDVTARLLVPYDGHEQAFLVRFDSISGLITQISTQRYRGQEEKKTPWQLRCLNWTTFHGMIVPARVAAIWEDERSPRSYMSVDGVEYNVDVSGKVRRDEILVA